MTLIFRGMAIGFRVFVDTNPISSASSSILISLFLIALLSAFQDPRLLSRSMAFIMRYPPFALWNAPGFIMVKSV